MDRIPAGTMDGFNAEHPFKGSRVWRAARLVLGVLSPPGETEREAAPFDPADLVPVHAVLLDRWTKEPLRNALCFVTDSRDAMVAVTPARFVFDEPDWLKSSTLPHLAIEIDRAHRRAGSNDWAKAGIRQEIPGRKVRLIRFEEHRLLLAETEVATVPLWDEAAIPCVFQEFVETDPDFVRSLFARQTAEKILTWQRRKFRSAGIGRLVPQRPGRAASCVGSFRRSLTSFR